MAISAVGAGREDRGYLGFREKPAILSTGIRQSKKVALFRGLFRGRCDVFPVERLGFWLSCCNGISQNALAKHP